MAIIAASEPVKPDSPTKTAASLSSISIAWIAPDDGGSDIISYTLKMNEGTGSLVYNVIDSSIPAGTTTYTKSGLTTGDEYRFIVFAINAVDSSADSDPSTAIIVAVTPDAPSDPSYLSSSETTMQFGWSSPVDAGRSNGGTTLLGYKIQWDDGDSDAVSLTDLVTINDAAATSFTIDSASYSISTGTIYRVRVLAFNSVGTGSPSSVLEIMPASLPSAPNRPTIKVASSSQITIEWTQDANSDGGSPILDYIVYFDNGVGAN